MLKTRIYSNTGRVLKKPNMSREARSLIKSKLENLTLSLNLYQKFPAEVDRTTIGLSENRKITDIHRAQYNYEFDIESGKDVEYCLMNN